MKVFDKDFSTLVGIEWATDLVTSTLPIDESTISETPPCVTIDGEGVTDRIASASDEEILNTIRELFK